MGGKKTVRSAEEAFSYFESFTNLETGKTPYSERVYKLDRMKILLEHFDNPQNYFKCIHVAGTKGKGSTAALIASALKNAGYKTGLYLSPHVSSYTERMSVSLKSPKETSIVEITNRILAAVETLPLNFFSGNPKPTTFELLTLFAFLFFKESGCNYAVIEVGLGGRLDATNIILPECAVLTPIDYDHTEILGSNLRDIALEKGGIIKYGKPVFSGYQEPMVKDVFRTLCAQRQASLVFLDEAIEQFTVRSTTEDTQLTLKLANTKEIELKLTMLGDFQAENAGLAYLTVKHCFPWIEEKTIIDGFTAVDLPGRMELITRNPPVVLDGAHTPLSIRRLTSSFHKIFPQEGILIFGSVLGKNHVEMAKIISPFFEKIIISTPGFFKESDPDEVYRFFKELNSRTILERNPVDALDKALEWSRSQLPILVTGSFYMISEIRKLF